MSIPVSSNAAAGNNVIVGGVAPTTANPGQALDASGALLQMGSPVSSDPNLKLDPNDLRFGMAIQRYREARNRYGSRFTEYLRYLGITPSDARPQGLRDATADRGTAG